MPLLLQIENGRKKAKKGLVDRVNVENLTYDKILTANDAPVQIYTSDATRTVFLPSSGLEAGQKFEIWNANLYNENKNIVVNANGKNFQVTAGNKIVFRWNQVSWSSEFDSNVSIGGNGDCHVYGIGIGEGAGTNNSRGVGIGYFARLNYNYGIGIGYYATGNYEYGVGIGSNASWNNRYGTAVGADASTNGKGTNTVAIGAFSRAERCNEFVSTGSINASNKSLLSICKFREKDLPSKGGAWQELFLDASSARLVILAGSVVQFCLYLNAIRSDAVVKCWKVEGVIKRPSSGDVSLVGAVNKTVIAEDTGTTNWDCQVSANTTNQALKIEVKHDSATNVRFSGNCIITETRL